MPKAIDNRDRLIFALDVPTIEDARAWVDRLGDSVTFYKLGLEWQHDEIERVQTASWSRINQREVLHAEVVTADRAVRFGAGCPAEELEAICARVRAVLGLVADSRGPSALPRR